CSARRSICSSLIGCEHQEQVRMRALHFLWHKHFVGRLNPTQGQTMKSLSEILVVKSPTNRLSLKFSALEQHRCSVQVATSMGRPRPSQCSKKEVTPEHAATKHATRKKGSPVHNVTASEGASSSV